MSAHTVLHLTCTSIVPDVIISLRTIILTKNVWFSSEPTDQCWNTFTVHNYLCDHPYMSSDATLHIQLPQYC